MKPPTLKEQQEKEMTVIARISKALHNDLKKAARLDRRTMQSFVATAIEERIKLFLEEDIESRDFVPVGLRNDNYNRNPKGINRRR